VLLRALLLFALPLLCASEERTVVGAIRWDAWHGERSEVGKAVERNLSPEKWHGRLPFFAQVLSKDRVRIDGASQAILDREIQYARAGALDYWAFLLYADGSAMNHGLEHFLASTLKRGLRFCLILEQGQWSSEDVAIQQFTRIDSLLADPAYQRVAGSRPLLYILSAEPESKSWGAQQPQAAIRRLRALTLENPYVVVLDSRPKRAATLRQEFAADAISAYAYQRNGVNAPYAQLAREVEEFWDACRDIASAVVPLVMTGWDRRPRVEQPVFWETWQRPNAGIERFYAAPTPAELSTYVEHAVDWAQAHDAKAILIYAWNENDEGGWLVPTQKEGTSRLQAVRSALRHRRPLK